jgi:hypothetical protein
MKVADEILDDEELIEPVYEALRRRRPKSSTRGRKGTPAEVALRMLALKHMRNWSFDTLERGLLSIKLCLRPESHSSLKASLEHRIQLRQYGVDAMVSDAPFAVFK